MKLPVRITGHTLLGGDDNPNCFTLGDVRIVNMKMGPFERVVKSIGATDVEVTLLSDRVGLIDDPRFPVEEMHNRRWCRVCCPFGLLPPDQQRNELRTHTPFIKDGRLASWSWHQGTTHSDEEIDRFLSDLRAIGVVR